LKHKFEFIGNALTTFQILQPEKQWSNLNDSSKPPPYQYINTTQQVYIIMFSYIAKYNGKWCAMLETQFYFVGKEHLNNIIPGML